MKEFKMKPAEIAAEIEMMKTAGKMARLSFIYQQTSDKKKREKIKKQFNSMKPKAKKAGLNESDINRIWLYNIAW